MIVLGVETSCDETSVSIVKDGKEVLSNIIYTQIDIHKLYGGVVPEVASRHHLKKITYVFDQALKEANMEPKDIDLVAVTSHPGLIGSLLVGINAAKTFALAHHIKYVEVDHIVGHIYANYIESDFNFPILALVVSGGHTELVYMKEHYSFEVLGETLDDAVGEAYDKVGRVMDLQYPAGAKVDKLAHEGKPTYHLPVYADKDSYNFSFSGLKSAVLNLVNTAKMKGEEIDTKDLACSFQNSVTTVLTEKTIKAAKEYKVNQIVVAGGVAANKGLRERLSEAANKENIKLTFPKMVYCTDNAVMIAVAGYFKYVCEKKI
ncbi:MAG: tRNA (adenosine(37)-N6)-threonylcarbamoyltransferase complex transferase subunit TsaD [Coprobacillus sp.]|nr:tRNA (adenosine(37)-N6)-threonylcarbamoyltransferase complex transferase subunit TsaD [Coprobacillus sp.]MDY4145343.1 tRNA (adenosine(37)-N6)-threonylcarbamoyltransferase complex transferase subunit TsaD [Bacilli bacterium]